MFIKILYLNLVVWPLIFAGHFESSNEIWAECIKVIDGDTIIVKSKGNKLKIRIAYIDAPELKQKSLDGVPVGEMAKHFLNNEIINKKVKIKLVEKDFFGRWVGLIYLDEKIINIELVKKGFAIIYPEAKFVSKKHISEILQAYYLAKLRGVGIWKTTGILNPKFFRKKRP